MFKKLLFLGLSASAALALEGTNPLFRRQSTCGVGWKACGDGCIPQLYTCCPSQKGGCSSVTSVCQLGNNGEYLCCPIGRVCVGSGGVTTIPGGGGGGGTIVSTRTIPVPGDDETSTSTSTFTIDVPGSTSTFTLDVPDVPSTTTTAQADETTNVPTPVIPDETSTTTTTSRRLIASGSPSATSVPTPTPPVTTNGAPSYSASVFQAIAAGVIALLAI